MAKANTAEWSKHDIQTAVEVLTQFYALGIADQKKKNNKPYGRSGTASEKEKLAKARLFAEIYSQSDLDELLSQCKSARWVPSQAHIIRLLSVPTGEARKSLQTRAISNRWSKRQLSTEIRREFGRHRWAAGRSVRVDGVRGAMLLFRQIGDQWEHLRTSVTKQLHVQAQGTGGRGPRIPPEVNAAASKVDRAMEELKDRIKGYFPVSPLKKK